MRVALDVGCLLHRQMGMASYANNLLRALSEADDGIEYVLLANSLRPAPVLDSLAALGPKFKVRNPRIPRPLWTCLKDRLGIPIELFCGRIDVFHSLDPVAPRTASAACVATVHDMIDFVLPESFPEVYLATPGWRRHYSMRQRLLRFSLTRTKQLIAVSENTKRDLMHYLAIPESRIDVIPYGVEPEFRRVNEDTRRETLNRYGVHDRGFLLYVGRFEHRKNVSAILEAMRILKSRGALTRRLVVCGWRGVPKDERRALDEIENLGLSGDVILLEYVAHSDLPAFYSEASVTLYPSFYEGFGLPPLESMACGTPVIASGASSIPEVVEDAAVLVDPSDGEALAAAITDVLSDEALRSGLQNAGLRRSTHYSWGSTAAATRAVHCGLASPSPA